MGAWEPKIFLLVCFSISVSCKYFQENELSRFTRDMENIIDNNITDNSNEIFENDANEKPGNFNFILLI